MSVAIVSALGLLTASGASAQGVTPATEPPPPVAAPAVAPPDPNLPAATPPPVATQPVPVPAPKSAPCPKQSTYDGPPLLLGNKIAVGGYGGPSVAYTRMLDQHGAIIGLEGALLLAHRLSIGLAGYGFSRTPTGPIAPDGDRRELGVGYGGLVLRYAFLTNLPVYPSVGMLIGGGAVVLHEEWEDHDDDDLDEEHDEGDGFFVFQPEVSLHANLTRWMRLGMSVGYRVTSSVHRFGLEESDLNGVTVGGNMQFGWL